MRPCHHLRPIIEDLARAQSELLRAARRCRPCGPMENEASRRRALVCWRTGRPHECDREGHPEPGRKAPAKTSGILALFQAASCSDDVRGSTRHPAQSTGHKLEPKVVPEKEEMLAAELRGVRERTLAFIEKTRGGDLSKSGWRIRFWEA